MSQGQLRTCYMGGTIMNLGGVTAAIQPTRFLAPPNCVGGELRRLSGGSLEIMPNVIAGGSIGGASASGTGYLIGISQIISWEGPAAFYLAATGATVVVSALMKFSDGATLL